MAIATWQLDPVHSSIHFSVRHMVVATLRGQFRRFHADLSLNEGDLTKSAVAIRIDADSVDTGHPDRDANLRSAAFLDVQQFSHVTFVSRQVEALGDNRYKVWGELTVRGVTRPVSLDVELGGFITDAKGLRRAGFTARAAIVRSEFGMVFNQLLEAGGVAIGDRVEVVAEIEAVARAAKAA